VRPGTPDRGVPCTLSSGICLGATTTLETATRPDTKPNPDFRDRFGSYYNREPNKPLFVTALLYLSEAWPNEWDAETLFLDEKTQTGFFVRPKQVRIGPKTSSHNPQPRPVRVGPLVL